MTDTRHKSRGGITPTGAVTFRIKHHLSRQHLFAARHLSDLASVLPNDGRHPNGPAGVDALHAYVGAAVVSAAFYLESFINEVYSMAADGFGDLMRGLDDQTIALFAEFWPHIERQSALHKYQTALCLARRKPFPKGEAPFQDADSLFKLRDTLAHFKPEWDDDANGSLARLQERLRGRFEQHGDLGSLALWFPHRCLTADCARWACETASGFVKAFEARLGVAIGKPRRVQPNSGLQQADRG